MLMLIPICLATGAVNRWMMLLLGIISVKGVWSGRVRGMMLFWLGIPYPLTASV